MKWRRLKGLLLLSTITYYPALSLFCILACPQTFARLHILWVAGVQEAHSVVLGVVWVVSLTLVRIAVLEYVSGRAAGHGDHLCWEGQGTRPAHTCTGVRVPARNTVERSSQEERDTIGLAEGV